ncbi:MAG: AtpZ/AtpI family protein [Oscillospiraceae bacterium]|nr:AtpZ/AtpI family protein [Oscillospiraceae bacterium]
MKSHEVVKALSLITQIGIYIVASVVVGVFLGRFLDNLLGTSPWLLLLFSLLGIGAAFKFLLDLIPKGEQNDPNAPGNAEDQKEQDSPEEQNDSDER